MNKCCIKSPDGWMILINSVKLHMFYFYFRAILQSPRVSAHDVNPPDPVFVITMMGGYYSQLYILVADI